jgi:hypothetical protein
MRLNRKIIYAVLTLIVLSPLTYPILFHLEQARLKHEARQKLEGQFLQRISLNKNEFSWTDENKEISINGELFDVKTCRFNNDRYDFTGLFDREETTIINKTNENCNQDKQGKKVLDELFRLLQAGFILHADNSWNENSSLSPVCFIMINLPDPAKTILTPPPQS